MTITSVMNCVAPAVRVVNNTASTIKARFANDLLVMVLVFIC